MDDAYSAWNRLLKRMAAPVALSLLSCSGGAAHKQTPGASVFPLGDPALAVHTEPGPAGLEFYFQQCGERTPGYVRHYILVDRILSDERWESVCSVKSVGLRCFGSVWRYGEIPEGWEETRPCAQLVPGEEYRIWGDTHGFQKFSVMQNGSVRLLDGLCAFEPAGGRLSDAERQRYGWACRDTGP